MADSAARLNAPDDDSGHALNPLEDPDAELIDVMLYNVAQLNKRADQRDHTLRSLTEGFGRIEHMLGSLMHPSYSSAEGPVANSPAPPRSDEPFFTPHTPYPNKMTAPSYDYAAALVNYPQPNRILDFAGIARGRATSTLGQLSLTLGLSSVVAASGSTGALGLASGSGLADARNDPDQQSNVPRSTVALTKAREKNRGQRSRPATQHSPEVQMSLMDLDTSFAEEWEPFGVRCLNIIQSDPTATPQACRRPRLTA